MTRFVRFRWPGEPTPRGIITTLSVAALLLASTAAAGGPASTAGVNTQTYAVAGFLQTDPFINPHGGYDETTNLCLECHDLHEAPVPELLAASTEKETCYRCHDGSGATTDIRSEFGEETIGSSTQASYHPLPHDLDGYSVKCGDCHTPHMTDAESTTLLRLNDGAGGWIYSPPDAPIGNAFCYRCHGTASPFPEPYADHTYFEGSLHQSAIVTPTSDAEIDCLTCHTPHGSTHQGLSEQEATCFTCHNASTPNTNPDLPFDSTELEYAFTAAPNDYDTTDADGLIRIYHHPIGDAEQDDGNRQVECASCHDVHVIDAEFSSTTSKLSNPGDTTGKVAVTWSDATYTRGTISLFCVECHQSPAVTSPIDAGPQVPYDIRLVDDSSALDGSNEPHDAFTAAHYFNDSTHGSEVGLACTACHDPHGSSNAFLLREYVISPGEGGVPAGQVSPRITGFNDEDTEVQQGILTSFCDGCHSDHHSPNQICTNCHYHGSGRF